MGLDFVNKITILAKRTPQTYSAYVNRARYIE